MELMWYGPCSVFPDDLKCSVFSHPLAGQPGIYLWTVNSNGLYHVNYVGISDRSIAYRIATHVSAYFAGKYKVYDSAELANLNNRDPAIIYPTAETADFRAHYARVLPHIIGCLGTYTIFFCPLIPSYDQELKDIESALIKQLGGPRQGFLDNNNRGHGSDSYALPCMYCSPGISILGLRLTPKPVPPVSMPTPSAPAHGPGALTSLFDALIQRRADAVKCLIATGANVNARTSGGYHPLFIAISTEQTDLMTLLIASGADVNAITTTSANSDGGTLLHYAVTSERLEATELLLISGATPNTKDLRGYTPLDRAKEVGNSELIQLIQRHGGTSGFCSPID
jgi:hypothetical protein